MNAQDGDTKLKLFGFFGADEAEYFVSDDAVWCRVATLSDNEADETMPLADGMFAPGDVVKVRFDKHGEIDLIQFIYDESKQKYMLVSEEAPDAEPANPSGYDSALTLSEDGFTRSLILFESGE